MGDPWSTDDLRLSDPDAYLPPGQRTPGGQASNWTGGMPTSNYPDFGMAVSSAATPPFQPAQPLQDLTPWQQPATPNPYATPGAVSAPAAVVAKTPQRGRLGLIALAVVTLGTLIGGFLLYQAIASVSIISSDPLGDGLLWLTGWVGFDVVITIGLILAVIALIRGSRRGFAGVSLAIGIFVTPLVFLGAVQLGADAVQERARAQLAGSAGAAGTSLMAYADEHDVDLGPFRPILAALLDDGR